MVILGSILFVLAINWIIFNFSTFVNPGGWKDTLNGMFLYFTPIILLLVGVYLVVGQH